MERDKQPVRQRIACVKKIEGNPLDAVSGGRLCARGQAAVQSLYHPDRVRGPMQRAGDRGAAKFNAVDWDAAIASAHATIAVPLRGGDVYRLVMSPDETALLLARVQFAFTISFHFIFTAFSIGDPAGAL